MIFCHLCVTPDRDDKEKELFREYERPSGEINADSSLDSFIVSFRTDAELPYRSG